MTDGGVLEVRHGEGDGWVTASTLWERSRARTSDRSSVDGVGQLQRESLGKVRSVWRLGITDSEAKDGARELIGRYRGAGEGNPWSDVGYSAFVMPSQWEATTPSTKRADWMHVYLYH